ncbi:MAG TPA: nucleoside 2-deoxyribosyltransferase domain-containing protein [Candidatus Nitrosopolaris sp.]|nr:nucleoside 2-deoxyribosyltransferase domain-containing protein [Candidatus Nitrosopolaris sp.]
MSIRVHRPPEIQNSDGPGIFLAGPIQGAPNWQADAVNHFEDLLKNEATVNIFNPRASSLDHTKEDQILWEKKYLLHARRYGAIMFWFAAQDHSIKDYPVGRAYAQTSRIELGRAIGWKDYAYLIRLGIGIDPDYTGGNEDYIKSCAKEHKIPVYDSLARLCTHVVELCQTEM